MKSCTTTFEPRTRHDGLPHQNPWIIPAWSVLLSILTQWPFWATLTTVDMTNKAFALRDMFLPAQITVNNITMGATEGAPRAVPQDAILAILSPAIPAYTMAALVMVFSGSLGSFAAAKMVQTMAGGRLIAQFAASLLVVWNPFVVERLLQGHWSLVSAAMLLPAVAYFAASRLWGMLLIVMTVCALTPTGVILAAIIALVFLTQWVQRLWIFLVSLLLSAPWLIATLVNSNATGGTLADPASAAVFAPRAEHHTGTFGALLSLGGIWNVEASAPSRHTLSELVGIALTAILILGIRELWRVYRGLTILTIAGFIVPALLSTDPGLALMGWLISTVPGAGLLRDSQKFVALAFPGMVLLTGVVIERMDYRRDRSKSFFPVTEVRKKPISTRWLQRGVGVLLCALIIGNVPGLPKDIEPVAPRPLSPVWGQISNSVSAAPRGKVLLLPPGNYRMLDDYPVIDPALKLLPGTPLDPGYLVVDGRIVDGNRTSMELLLAIMQGHDTLEANGVGWVLIDWGSVSEQLNMSRAIKALQDGGYQRALDIDKYSLYRIPNPNLDNEQITDVPVRLGIGLFWLVATVGFWLAIWALYAAWVRYPEWWRWKYLSGRTPVPIHDDPKEVGVR
ncbi:hypothetical protein [Corynebacterium auriscanis]|uniref:hypothetical protein n=1 Tax=Corynebacterium auriscanis TaxID=99807 RepID=UPI00224789BF|nr:hypothetical protein [Corynebacterium auriscanis]MCX2163886.1 hypothetical protein [Corynebacterium auriscanis]